MTPVRNCLIGMTLFFVASCGTVSGPGGLITARSQLEAARTAEELLRVADIAGAGAARASTVSMDDLLEWTVLEMEAHNRASWLGGVSNEAFEMHRQAVFKSADTARTLCLSGKVDPRLGRSCALAAASRALNDGVRAGRRFKASLELSDWSGAGQAADAFTDVALTAAQQFKEDIGGLAAAGSDATPFEQMLLRSACTFPAAYSRSPLMTASGEPGMAETKAAYARAMASAARATATAPEGTACAGGAYNRSACNWNLEAGLANRCTAEQGQ